jgi:hypothetical protein
MSDRPDAVLGDPLSPYLTTEEAARYLRFPDTPIRALLFRQWAKRQGLQPSRRGRILLWERRYLDRVVAPPTALALVRKRGAR